MKKLILLAVFLLMGAHAYATEYIETFDDPLGGWRDRWAAQYTNLQNYYICSGSTTDENYRGNNPCGIWVCDGVPGGSANVVFDAAFGATISTFEIGIQSFMGDEVLNVYDAGGALIFSQALVANYGSPYGCYCTLFTVQTTTGVSRFEITGSFVEGNTAVDDFRVVTEGATPVESTTWGAVKSAFR